MDENTQIDAGIGSYFNMNKHNLNVNLDGWLNC